jgi:hypothetical protein
MTILKNNKIELREIGDNDDLLEIVIKNQFWFKSEDVKDKILEFEEFLIDYISNFDDEFGSMEKCLKEKHKAKDLFKTFLKATVET